jgi:galactoside O-acetyltransferase
MLKIKSVLRRIYGYYLRSHIKVIGKNFVPAFPLVITGGENINIGANFRSMGSAYLYSNNGKLQIGDNLNLNTNVQIGAADGKIIIGNDVLIGPNVVIRAADHGLSRQSHIRDQDHNGGTIIIDDDVWIGANAVILKNVRLGTGCVVASGSVVTKDVMEFEIVGGIPAKKISKRY